MENAAALFGLAAALSGFGMVIHVAVTSWLRIRQFERDGRPQLTDSGREVAEIAARLARIEQVVETTALEVERISEAQRYTAQLLARPRAAAPAHDKPARVVTPH